MLVLGMKLFLVMMVGCGRVVVSSPLMSWLSKLRMGLGMAFSCSLLKVN